MQSEPPDIATVASRVENLLKELTQLEELPVDEAGNWGPFPAGTAIVLCRVGQPAPKAPPIVAIFSPVLAQVPKSLELLDYLNTVNSQVSFLRAYWAREWIFLSTELLAQTLDREELLIATAQVANFADAYDERLRELFGGHRPAADWEEGWGDLNLLGGL